MSVSSSPSSGRRVYRADRRRSGRSAAASGRRYAQPARRLGADQLARGREPERARRCRAPARVSRSTSVARAAPRESASIASAPVPQKRSSTPAPADVAENREHRLADAVGGRPHASERPRRDEAPAPQLAGDRSLTPGSDRPRRRTGGGRLEQRPELRRRRASRAVAAARSPRARASISGRGPRAARRRGSAAGRAGGCRGSRPRRAVPGRPRRA